VCGIIGYIGIKEATPILINGLKKLEYRGYDSFGIATLSTCIECDKHQGKISDSSILISNLKGKIGIGHTRWATHGIPNDINAHPHLDCSNNIAIIHNGIVENYVKLKQELVARGHIFRSDTDTEVIVHLIEEEYILEKDILLAVQKTIVQLIGTYALLVIATGENKIIAARYASPLVIGIGDHEFFAASDMMPILEHTNKVVYLEDGDVASISCTQVEIFNNNELVKRPVEIINWLQEIPQKGGFSHYMIKEIYEQPQIFYNSVKSITSKTLPAIIKDSESITVIACGSSYHTGLIFKYLMEDFCAIPVRLDFASEFKYFPPPIKGLVIGISQSGETADTLYALKQAKMHICTTLAITNVMGSSISRSADFTVFMYAKPEISVAATKSVIAQLAILMQIVNSICNEEFEDVLLNGHRAIEEILLMDISDAVNLCKSAHSIMYVGRGPFYPVILEGALKMKEISYIHAEGFPAGELKHGSFALLSSETPVIAICMPGDTYNVMVSNIKEMKARGAPVIVLGEEGDLELPKIVDVFIPLPQTHLFIQILTTLVVLQLLAYYTAVNLERDVDKPRNLAKSVTVE
jgi:glutamine---fructose-6-phosphate transaminase (isomerizing)